MEVQNRLKGLDLIGRVPDELWTEVRDIVQEAVIKTIPKKKKCIRKTTVNKTDKIPCPTGAHIPMVKKKNYHYHLEDIKLLLFQSLSHVQLFCEPKTDAHQAPLSMGFPRQEYWSGFPFHSLGGLPNPGIEPAFPAFAGEFFTTKPLGKTIILNS